MTEEQRQNIIALTSKMLEATTQYDYYRIVLEDAKRKFYLALDNATEK